MRGISCKMKQHLQRWLQIVVILIIPLILYPITANAGGLNANEAQVIGAISGTFYYDGKAYKADPAYLAEARSYLSQDGVDLTAEQCNELIGNISGNVGMAVQNGYIIPVEGSTGEEDKNQTEKEQEEKDSGEDLEKDPSEEEKNSNKKKENSEKEDSKQESNEQDSNKNENKSNDENKLDTKKQDNEKSESNTTSEENQSDIMIGEDSEEKDVESELDLDKNQDGIISEEDTSIEEENNSVYHNVIISDKINDVIFENEIENDSEYSFINEIIKKTGQSLYKVILIGIILVCVVALVLIITSFYRIKTGKKHGKVRKVCSISISILLGVLCFVILTVGGLLTGLFNRQLIIEKVTKSGYYEKSYQVFLNQTESLLKETNLPNAWIEETISFRRYYMVQRDYIANGLKGKEARLLTQKLTEELLEPITITSENEEKINNLMTRIMTQYEKNVKPEFVPIIYNSRKTFIKLSIVIVIVCCLVIAGLIFMLFHMYQHRHKSISYLVYGVIGASLLEIIFTVLLKRIDYQSISNIEHYQKWISLYIKESINVFLYMGGAGILLIIALCGILRSMKDKGK